METESGNGTIYHPGSELFFKVVPPILLIIGTVGNILSIVILRRKSMRRSGLSKYLICLAAVDLCVIYVGLLPQCILFIGNTNVEEVNVGLCKTMVWLNYTFLDASAWILVCATIVRVISVWKPLHVKIICTRRIFVLIIVAVFLIPLIINVHFLFGKDLVFNNVTNRSSCDDISTGYGDFQDGIFSWIDLVINSLGPFLFQIISNIIIIALLRKANHRITSMTKMLIVLNIFYLVCTLPIACYFIDKKIHDRPPTRVRDRIFYYLNLIAYLNNCTNFLAYTLSGYRFRSELKSIIHGGFWRQTGSAELSRSTLSTSQSYDRNSNIPMSSIFAITGPDQVDTRKV